LRSNSEKSRSAEAKYLNLNALYNDMDPITHIDFLEDRARISYHLRQPYGVPDEDGIIDVFYNQIESLPLPPEIQKNQTWAELLDLYVPHLGKTICFEHVSGRSGGGPPEESLSGPYLRECLVPLEELIEKLRKGDGHKTEDKTGFAHNWRHVIFGENTVTLHKKVSYDGEEEGTLERFETMWSSDVPRDVITMSLSELARAGYVKLNLESDVTETSSGRRAYDYPKSPFTRKYRTNLIIEMKLKNNRLKLTFTNPKELCDADYL